MNKIFFIIFIAFQINSKQTDFSCKKLFQEDFKFFYFHKGDKILEDSITIYQGEDDQIKGKVVTSICEEFDIPAECRNQGKAKFVFVPEDLQKNECIVITKTKNWEANYSKNELQEFYFHFQQLNNLKVKNSKSDSVSLEEKQEIYKLDYQFICEENIVEPIYRFSYIANKQVFQITVRSIYGCGVDLGFFRILSQYSLVTAITFLTIGLLFCFLGYKIYKEFLFFFIPLLIIVLCFYLYMVYYEKSLSQNSNFYYILGFIFLIIVVVSLLVLFSNCLYFLLAFLVSYKVGMILHNFLEKEIPFFTKDYTEWIVIGLLALIFVILFLQIKDYFVIFCTALLGSSFIILSVHYFGFSDFDFLFELEFNKFEDVKKLDPMYINFIMIFFLITLIGAFTQMILFQRKHSKKNKKDNLNLELNFNN
jgi:hypothetical protein